MDDLFFIDQIHIMSIVCRHRMYHPLIILLYQSGMLDTEQLAKIPKTTRHNWNKFEHTDYFGHEWVVDYINQLDYIKTVFKSRYSKKLLRTVLIIRNGYYNMLKEFMNNKHLLKLNTNNIVESIDHISAVTKLQVKRICKFYGVSRDWYYTNKKRLICKISPIKLCYKRQPNQLTRSEVARIEQLIFDVRNYGKTKTTLYYQGLRNHLFFCAKSTFFKYATALGYKKPKPVKPKHKIGLRAARVFAWLHIDITFVPTLKDGIQKVAFVKDNYSIIKTIIPSFI